MKIHPFILVLAALPCLSHAATISQTVTLDAAQLYVSGTLPGTSSIFVGQDFGDYLFTFDRFDPSLGILTDVSFSNSVTHTVSATPSSVDGVTLNLGYGISYTINGNSFSGGGTGNGTFSATVGEPASLNATVGTTDESIASEFYDEFQGTGTTELGIIRSGAGPLTFNGEISGFFTDYSIQRDAGAFATLTYTYEPIPEPSAAAMFGLVGTCGLLLRRRF